jgi:N-acetylglutamate synthase-like GNAT family acetyltransferase
MDPMIRACDDQDAEEILDIVNDAARAYEGVIPPDRWHEPYMSGDELAAELAAGVRFSGWEAGGRLLGVMGIQALADVALIRHAYVRTADRRAGIGGRLLDHLLAQSERPFLVGTWAAATWAIDFYGKHGFEPTTVDETRVLLGRYWSIPERQIETSVVLAEADWLRHWRRAADGR